MTAGEPKPLERAVAAETAAAAELARIPTWIWDGETLPVPIARICDSHYGLLIEEHDDLGRLIGMAAGTRLSGLLLPDVREVWVNAGEAPVRRRFTVGHELGHWVLHHAPGSSSGQAIHCRETEVSEGGAAESVPEDLGATLSATYLAYPPRELDANQFAAALLMPASIAREQADLMEHKSLCRRFDVSPEALTRRLWFLRSMAGPRGVGASPSG